MTHVTNWPSTSRVSGHPDLCQSTDRWPSRHGRQMRERLANFLFRILVVNQLVSKIPFVGRHVEITVTAEVKEDCLFLALFLRLEGLVDGAADRMRSLGRNNDSFGLGEGDRGVETLQLGICLL